MSKVCEGQRQSLFGDALVPKLESLRNDAGPGIGMFGKISQPKVLRRAQQSRSPQEIYEGTS
ncbi:MAG: hypothetical protein AUG89_06855 [Acidobacteria bacterium 13_1_20CM_4_56_7]|nr:MAG: hypothetical protein AUG89_06855 [Acidobacteria bacterium 13_1_20CM_4_56_7]